MSSNRQLKVAKQIQQDLAEIFRVRAADFSGKMISVTHVEITADLGTAKVHVSIFPSENKRDILEDIKAETKSIRYALGQKIKNQLRKVPELYFYPDDTLDEADSISELLKD
jgi:ribosome-binding factor A